MNVVILLRVMKDGEMATKKKRNRGAKIDYDKAKSKHPCQHQRGFNRGESSELKKLKTDAAVASFLLDLWVVLVLLRLRQYRFVML